MMRTSFKQ